MGDEVIFEELPERATTQARTGGTYARWALTLRERPGDWARIPLRDATAKRWWAAKGYELAVRTVDGEKRVYGRYVGTP